MEDGTMTGMMTEDEFLVHMELRADMSDDEFFAHFGKKGMKWGVRSATSSTGMTNRELNKASRAKDKVLAKKEVAKRDRSIDKARAQVGDGKGRATLKAAKVQYKADKKEIGSREARKALSAVRSKVMKTRETANLAKSGAETRNAVLQAIAYQGLVGIVTARA